MLDLHLWKGFQQLDEDLARHGVPRTSPAWLSDVERHYCHPTATRWIGCVGRGGGKNLVGVKCDLTELLFGTFAIPPGERHFHVHTAENRTEAEKTLAQAVQYCRFLGVTHTSTADTINFGGKLHDRGLKVLANRIGANSGFRSTGGTTQETAKWNDEGTNPSEEVVTSWAAQMITHERARQRHFSTPMARDGFFFDMFAKGDTTDQIVTQGPTWIFNPSVTEALCRARSTSERVFLREYKAEPQAGACSAFDQDAIDLAFNHARPAGVVGRWHVIADPSSGKKDTFSRCRAAWVSPVRGTKGLPYLRFEDIEGDEGSFWRQVTGDQLVEKICATARRGGAREVHADQREELMLRSAVEKRGLRYVVHPWTATSKPNAVERVRRWLADGTIALPDHKRMRSELLAFEERITPSGQFTFAARGNGHDDYVALLITAALAEIDGDLVAPGGRAAAPGVLVEGDPNHSRWAGMGRGGYG